VISLEGLSVLRKMGVWSGWRCAWNETDSCLASCSQRAIERAAPTCIALEQKQSKWKGGTVDFTNLGLVFRRWLGEGKAGIMDGKKEDSERLRACTCLLC
jgi:hypothetical protein